MSTVTDVTWLNIETAFNGVVSSGNSLVGGTAGDRVGSEIGVVVIPSALAEKVAEEGANTDSRDAFSREKVLSGAVTVEQAFPLKPELMPEYEEWKKTHA